MRRLAFVVVAAWLAGCGGQAAGDEKATLWITRGGSDHVVLARSVPAGLTAMQVLKREAEVETRYGGRFVQSINGTEGSLSSRRDWFYFVNGIEADRSATEYRMQAGDIVWWDYRSWQRRNQQPVVVGAFPEPFLHGYAGERRRAVVRYEAPALERGARAIARLIRARSVARAGTPVPPGANVFVVATGPRRFRAELRGEGAGAPVRFVLAGDAVRLARNPTLVRYRYAGMP